MTFWLQEGQSRIFWKNYWTDCDRIAFMQSAVEYLGHWTDAHGVHAALSKVETIQ